MTDNRGVYSIKQTMPWPIDPREMKITGTGLCDKNNKAFLFVMKSVETGF